jgi:hypothetical protein
MHQRQTIRVFTLFFLTLGFGLVVHFSARAQLVPTLVGQVHDVGETTGVAVSGNYCYTANFYNGLRIYDVSDPTHPFNVGQITNGAYAWAVAVSGHYAYVADDTNGLAVYDVADPTNPINVTNVNNWQPYNATAAYGIAISSNYVYLANFGDALRIYDISNPTNPIEVGHAYSVGGAKNVRVSGHYAYLAGGLLQICDITDPTNPIYLGKPSDPWLSQTTAYDVAVSGHYAYVAANGLLTVDLSNPTNPVTIWGVVRTTVTNYNGQTPFANAITVSGSSLYVVNLANNSALSTYDISNPVKTVSAGQGAGTAGSGLGWRNEVAVSGHYAYIACTHGLLIYSLGDPPHTLLSMGLTGAYLAFNWPLGSAGFSLQQSTNLNGTNWMDIEVFFPHGEVTVARPTNDTFYRLRFPPAY